MPMTAKDLMLTVGQKFSATILGEKFEICARGWHDGKYIIIDIPMYRNEPLTLASLTGCDFLFVKDGTYIRFHSKIIRVFYQSPPFMAISFPQYIDKTNVRKSERIQVLVPITFKVNGGGPTDGLIRDLSLDGVLITSARRLSKGDNVLISANLKLGVLNNVEATVQNVREYSKNKTLYNAAGLKFKTLSENDKKVLKSILVQQKDPASSMLATASR